MERFKPDAQAYLKKVLGWAPQAAPIQELLDATVEEADQGRGVVSMLASERHHNVVSVVHGGILTSLAEVAAAVAITTVLEPNEVFTFVAQTTNYERPVRRGRVTARAEVVRRGSTISLVEVVLSGDGQKEVARATFTTFSHKVGERATQ